MRKITILLITLFLISASCWSYLLGVEKQPEVDNTWWESYDEGRTWRKLGKVVLYKWIDSDTLDVVVRNTDTLTLFRNDHRESACLEIILYPPRLSGKERK